MAILLLPVYLKYRKSEYKTASGNSFIRTLIDKGNYGEFLIFYKLEKLNGSHRLMTNLYLPKEDGSTTEVDLIMISETGIYVFESKNYSGWIFGDENQKNWTQSLKGNQKHRFYNPIWQNKGHISGLKYTLALDDAYFKSYIVFSDRCTLKKVSVKSKNIKVLKRNALLKSVGRDDLNSDLILSPQEVEAIYLKLKAYTCVDPSVKKAHIDHIKLKTYK